jgi:hypothetical protein
VYHIARRFQHFVDLHSKLKKQCNFDAVLPTKKLWGNLDPEFIQTRKLELQRYLERLLRNRTIADSVEMRDFLQPQIDIPAQAAPPSMLTSASASASAAASVVFAYPAGAAAGTRAAFSNFFRKEEEYRYSAEDDVDNNLNEATSIQNDAAIIQNDTVLKRIGGMPRAVLTRVSVLSRAASDPALLKAEKAERQTNPTPDISSNSPLPAFLSAQSSPSMIDTSPSATRTRANATASTSLASSSTSLASSSAAGSTLGVVAGAGRQPSIKKEKEKEKDKVL